MLSRVEEVTVSARAFGWVAAAVVALVVTAAIGATWGSTVVLAYAVVLAIRAIMDG